MRGIKKESTLRLERESQREFLTISEAVPELSVIAKQENKNLNIVSEFKHCVRILDARKLSQR